MYPAFSQIDCDTLSKEIVGELNTYSPRKFKRLKHEKKIEPIMVYNIATYFRQKSDTTYKQWYERYLFLANKRWHHGRVRDGGIWYSCMIFRMGKAYYFLGNYPQALFWFIRSIKCNCPDDCVKDYYSEVVMRVKK